MSGMARIRARWQPEAWVDGEALAVDGAVDFDVTRKVLCLPLRDVHALADGSRASDTLAWGETFYEEHDGPYRVEAAAAICGFFGVGSLSAITAAMLAAARRVARDAGGVDAAAPPPEAVLLVGSLSDGFRAVGPYARADDAWLAADRLPFAAALPLVAPPDAAAGEASTRGLLDPEGAGAEDGGEPAAVVLVGNPADGWRVWGPYIDLEAAAASRAGQEAGSWVLSLESPDMGLTRAATVCAAA